MEELNKCKNYLKNLKENYLKKKDLKKKIASYDDGKCYVAIVVNEMVSSVYSYPWGGHVYIYESMYFVTVSRGSYDKSKYIEYDTTQKQIENIAFDLKKDLYERCQNDKTSI